MAKKKKKSVKKWVDLVGVVIGLLALATLFLPVVGIKVGEETEAYTGLQAFFGYVHVEPIFGSSVVAETEIFKFSFLGILQYVAIAGAVVLLILNILGKGGKGTNLIALALFVAGAVLAFSALGFAVPGENQILNTSILTKAWKLENLSLLWGGIATGVLAILGALANAYKIFSK